MPSPERWKLQALTREYVSPSWLDHHNSSCFNLLAADGPSPPQRQLSPLCFGMSALEWPRSAFKTVSTQDFGYAVRTSKAPMKVATEPQHSDSHGSQAQSKMCGASGYKPRQATTGLNPLLVAIFFPVFRFKRSLGIGAFGTERISA